MGVDKSRKMTAGFFFDGKDIISSRQFGVKNDTFRQGTCLKGRIGWGHHIERMEVRSLYVNREKKKGWKASLRLVGGLRKG